MNHWLIDWLIDLINFTFRTAPPLLLPSVSLMSLIFVSPLVSPLPVEKEAVASASTGAATTTTLRSASRSINLHWSRRGSVTFPRRERPPPTTAVESAQICGIFVIFSFGSSTALTKEGKAPSIMAAAYPSSPTRRTRPRATSSCSRRARLGPLSRVKRCSVASWRWIWWSVTEGKEVAVHAVRMALIRRWLVLVLDTIAVVATSDLGGDFGAEESCLLKSVRKKRNSVQTQLWNCYKSRLELCFVTSCLYLRWAAVT